MQDGLSDTQGFFSFDSVPIGDYRVEAIDTASRGAMASVIVDGKSQQVVVADLKVDTTGWIIGNVDYLGSTQSKFKITIAIYGLERWTYAISGGDFTLSALPVGKYTLRISSSGTPPLSTQLKDVEVKAGVRTPVDTVVLGP